jgi:hypothetical protein
MLTTSGCYEKKIGYEKGYEKILLMLKMKLDIVIIKR